MRVAIGVIGSASRPHRPVPSAALEAAELVGAAVAAAGAVLMTGGTGGVMEAASRGAHRAGGFTVGFLPQSDRSHANAHLDLALPTGMGTLRNVLTARASDAVIVVAGGVGTLNEMTLAYDAGVPIVVLAGTGGIADRVSALLLDGRWLDERSVTAVTFAKDPAEAVRMAIARAGEPRTGTAAVVGAAGD